MRPIRKLNESQIVYQLRLINYNLERITAEIEKHNNN